MSPAPERWVLCGGAAAREAPADALRLELGRGSDGVAGLTIDIAGLDARSGERAATASPNAAALSWRQAVTPTSSGSQTHVTRRGPWSARIAAMSGLRSSRSWQYPVWCAAIAGCVQSRRSQRRYAEPSAGSTQPGGVRDAFRPAARDTASRGRRSLRGSPA